MPRDEGRIAARALGQHQASVGYRLEDPDPLEVVPLPLVHVQEDPAPSEQLVLA